MMSVCSTECDRSNIFVCFLKEKNSQSLKLEVEHGHLNNPLARPSVFLLIPSSMRSKSAGDGGGGGEVERLKSRIRKAGDHARVLECVEDGSEGLQWVSEQIQTILKRVTNNTVLKPIGVTTLIRHSMFCMQYSAT
jgi:hypothetical protein